MTTQAIRANKARIATKKISLSEKVIVEKARTSKKISLSEKIIIEKARISSSYLVAKKIAGEKNSRIK